MPRRRSSPPSPGPTLPDRTVSGARSRRRVGAISVVAGAVLACGALGVAPASSAAAASGAPTEPVSVAAGAGSPIGAVDATGTTLRPLPRTGLEAEELDQGTNGGAGWMGASALAAGVVVLGGGLVLKRRIDREDRQRSSG